MTDMRALSGQLPDSFEQRWPAWRGVVGQETALAGIRAIIGIFGECRQNGHARSRPKPI